MTDAAPAVLPLRQHDPLPPLGLPAPERAAWRLLLSADAATATEAARLLAATAEARPRLSRWLLLRGEAELAPSEAYTLRADLDGTLADLLGALADASGRRAAMWVLVEPRGTVQAVACGLTDAAVAEVLAPLRPAG